MTKSLKSNTKLPEDNELIPTIFRTASDILTVTEEGGRNILNGKDIRFPTKGYSKIVVNSKGEPKKPFYVFPRIKFTIDNFQYKSMLFKVKRNDIVITTKYRSTLPNRDGYIKFNIYRFKDIDRLGPLLDDPLSYDLLISWHLKLEGREHIFESYSNELPFSEIKLSKFVWETIRRILRNADLEELHLLVMKAIIKSIISETTYISYTKCKLPMTLNL
jgi:hypothetical protein